MNKKVNTKILETILGLIENISIEFIKPRSRYKTLFKILFAVVVLNILYRILIPKLSNYEEILQEFLPTINNVSKVTNLKRGTVSNYIALLEKQGIVKKSVYVWRRGRLHIIQEIPISRDTINIPNVPSLLSSIREISKELGSIIEKDPVRKYMLFKALMSMIEMTYEVIDNIYRIAKKYSKNIVKKLKLNYTRERLTYYIYYVESYEELCIELSKDIEVLVNAFRKLQQQQIELLTL